MMIQSVRNCPSRYSLPFVMILTFLCMSLGSQAVLADIILFTASTDNTGGVNPISVPNNNNPYIPSIDPGVTVTPNQALLDGNTVGPLNGITYGPYGFINDTGGTTGFVNVAYTIETTGLFRLVWEVSNTIDCTGQSGLATDNVLLNGNPLFNFQNGGLGVLPTGLTGAARTGPPARSPVWLRAEETRRSPGSTRLAGRRQSTTPSMRIPHRNFLRDPWPPRARPSASMPHS